MKYPLPLKALELLNRGLAIYAEVAPSRPDLRKWLRVNPYRLADDQPYRYVVWSFELLVSDLVHEYDVAGREENMVDYEFDNLDGALACLDGLQLHPSAGDNLADALACLDGLQEQPVHWESWQETDCPI